MQTHTVQRIELEWLPFRRPLPTASILPPAQAPDNEVVHLVELSIGIPRPEIVPPAAKHERQFRDDLLHIFPAVPLARDLPNTVTEFLRRLRARPPLPEMLVRRPASSH
jgi:hypothetical protein